MHAERLVVLSLLAVVVVGYFGASSLHLLARRSKSIGLFMLMGGHFLFLGIALGPAGLGLVHPEALNASRPLINLAFGWIGLILGLQLEVRSLAQLPRHQWWTTLARAAITFGFVYLFAAVILGSWFGWSSAKWPLVAESLGGVAMMTSPIPLAFLFQRYRVRSAKAESMLLSTHLDGILAIICFQFVLLRHAPDKETLYHFGLAVILGIAIGLIAHFFLLYSVGRNERIAILLGLIFLSVGTSFSLSLLPMFVSLIVGFVLANFSPRRDVAFRILAEWEHPVYVILVILAGVNFVVPHSRTAIWLIGSLTLVTLFGKYLGGMWGRHFAPFPTGWGYPALHLPLGVVALSLSIAFIHSQPAAVGSFFHSVILAVFLLTASVAHKVGKQALRDEGMLPGKGVTQ